MVKKKPKSKTIKQNEVCTEAASSNIMDESLISAACKSQTVLMKVCRLCESKDGPFLNIFDADTTTIKKIDEIMPFEITENDDLPHKICFRCSAKVEELYEFIQKCVKSQNNLRTELCKKTTLYTKTRTRVLWENKLNKTNLSNDDICNALIKKAMEGIKDIPPNSLPKEEENPAPSSAKKIKMETTLSKKDAPEELYQTDLTNESDDEHDEISLKQVKLRIEKSDEKGLMTRASRSNKTENLFEGLPEPTKRIKQYPSGKQQDKIETTPIDSKPKDDTKQADKPSANDHKTTNPPVNDSKTEEPNKIVPNAEEAPPINIMDHVSIIKVNGVGTLFLCKLCNRNFLKKEVVFTHGCAKNNVPKDNLSQNQFAAPPQVPKPSTVKYIKTGGSFNKPETEIINKKLSASNTIQVNIPLEPEVKMKPKAGPASRVFHNNNVESPPQPKIVPPENKVVMNVPSVNFPGLPSLNTRYKLVPGPDNLFTLVEDFSSSNITKPQEVEPLPTSKGKKRKAPTAANLTEFEARCQKNDVKESSPGILIEDDDDLQFKPVVEKPYPVGLFQTAHHEMFAPPTQPPSFTTPAFKKQSYKVVQTGNPSKLLISAKPDDEEIKTKSRKSKVETRNYSRRENSKETLNVGLSDTGTSKDSGFFNFINVDPLLQPSYVLPTQNTIQESLISTSTPVSKPVENNVKDKEKYECNMCNEKFSREKKLLTHIQSHFTQMDEEDQKRAEKAPSKRKTRKS